MKRNHHYPAVMLVAVLAMSGCQNLREPVVADHSNLPGIEAASAPITGSPTATQGIAATRDTREAAAGEPGNATEQADGTPGLSATQAASSPVQQDLWPELRNSMRLDKHLQNKHVQKELRWLQRHPSYLPRLQERMQRYLPYIYAQTQLRDMPAELALLPIIESALDLSAFSRGGAAGPWQFVRGTARHYGLQMNEWYDGRRDIVASTDAALTYLSDLHKHFDDWYLALAGYNAGQGKVERARRRHPGAGFFELKLPRETQAFVPRLLALSAVIQDPEQYGLSLSALRPETSFATLQTHSQFQLDKLAVAVNLPLKNLYEWNPSLHQWSTPPDGPHRIIVPSNGNLQHAQAAIDAVAASARLEWQEVLIKPGDTLSAIALRHGSDVTALQLANNLPDSRIRAGKKLVIPQIGRSFSRRYLAANGNTASASYTVQAGDSLWSIARAHNVKLNTLIRSNHISPSEILQIGRTVNIPSNIPSNIPGKGSASPGATRTVHYKVRKGDSLSRIASKFNVSIKQIASWNNLDVRRYIKPGWGLLLHVNVAGG